VDNALVADEDEPNFDIEEVTKTIDEEAKPTGFLALR